MKIILKPITVLSLALFTSCGMSAEDKAKKIDEAAAMRSKQFCETADGSNNLEMYGQKLDYLLEQLREDGITEDADVNTATDTYDKMIRESCGDKFPK